MLTDGRTDGLTDGRTDGRTDGQKIGRLYRTLLQAGAIKIRTCVGQIRLGGWTERWPLREENIIPHHYFVARYKNGEKSSKCKSALKRNGLNYRRNNSDMEIFTFLLNV